VAKKKSAAYRRTRKDHSTEVREDYVEAIANFLRDTGSCHVSDLAAHFGVSHATVSKTVGRLRRDGLVSNAPYRPIELTPRGRRIAEAARERHELVLRFLKAIGVSAAVAEVDAEGLEHHLSPETLDCLERIVRGAKRPS
jgi:DtxR family manganese transport transcriptional regulator